MGKPIIGDSDEKIADTAVVGWMNSEGHRKNILYDGFYKEGIGVYLQQTDVFITQNFCGPFSGGITSKLYVVCLFGFIDATTATLPFFFWHCRLTALLS